MSIYLHPPASQASWVSRSPQKTLKTYHNLSLHKNHHPEKRPKLSTILSREMVFKDQRGFAMLFSFQNSIDSVCFCFHAHRLNTDLKIEQHSKTTLIFKKHFSSFFEMLWDVTSSLRNTIDTRNALILLDR